MIVLGMTNPAEDCAARQSRTARVVVACAVLASAAILTACTPSSGQPPQVASLVGSSVAATTGPPADQSGRPQLRLDSSKEEVNAMWRNYDVCLKEHGHKMLSEGGHPGPADANGNVDKNAPDKEDDSAASQAAKRACAGKLPLPPPEMDESKNPHYLDDYRTYIKCLNAHGLAVRATDPFGSGWTYDGPTKLDDLQQQKVEHDCTIEAFSGR